MAKQNYRQMKKQKESARKARQVEKQQRRQTRVDQPLDGQSGTGPEPVSAGGDAVAIPATGE